MVNDLATGSAGTVLWGPSATLHHLDVGERCPGASGCTQPFATQISFRRGTLALDDVSAYWATEQGVFRAAFQEACDGRACPAVLDSVDARGLLVGLDALYVAVRRAPDPNAPVTQRLGVILRLPR